ncbi:hypothetical protein O3P69_000299 [Scylla paramamosain]|uniref:Uncharacterized protein n=1 Tax=Scylla paramamosain TaxID=85552 RepID=A0AAW0UXA4_SCYPA
MEVTEGRGIREGACQVRKGQEGQRGISERCLGTRTLWLRDEAGETRRRGGGEEEETRGRRTKEIEAETAHVFTKS